MFPVLSGKSTFCHYNKSTFCHYKWLILDIYKKLFYAKFWGKNLPLSTRNIGLQKCMTYFCANHQKGIQISIQKQELGAADDN